jgi:HPt (histidine-containing phosphotransfer) domain-containing protein
MFREQLPQHYRDVVASVEADDVAAVAAKLHRLKGVAATMSAVPIASLVESMEPQVEHLNRETFTPSLARLEREVERCLDWIEAKLQEVNQA